MILQTDKTSLEIQTALLAGKQIFLKYNNEIIGKIIAEGAYSYSNEYKIEYLVNPNIFTYPFTGQSGGIRLESENIYASVAEAKASTDPVYLQINEQPNDPIINDPGSSR